MAALTRFRFLRLCLVGFMITRNSNVVLQYLRVLPAFIWQFICWEAIFHLLESARWLAVFRFRLKLQYLRFQIRNLRFQYLVFRQKLRIRRYNRLVERLYLLDDRRCLSVLRSLDETYKQGRDFGYSFKRGGNHAHQSGLCDVLESLKTNRYSTAELR